MKNYWEVEAATPEANAFYRLVDCDVAIAWMAMELLLAQGAYRVIYRGYDV